MGTFFLGKRCLLHFLHNKGENQTAFVIPLPFVDANIPRTRHSILFTQSLAHGPLRCSLGTSGRNVCSLRRLGMCGRRNLWLFGQLGCKDVDTWKRLGYRSFIRFCFQGDIKYASCLLEEKMQPKQIYADSAYVCKRGILISLLVFSYTEIISYINKWWSLG